MSLREKSADSWALGSSEGVICNNQGVFGSASPLASLALIPLQQKLLERSRQEVSNRKLERSLPVSDSEVRRPRRVMKQTQPSFSFPLLRSCDRCVTAVMWPDSVAGSEQAAVDDDEAQLKQTCVSSLSVPADTETPALRFIPLFFPSFPEVQLFVW